MFWRVTSCVSGSDTAAMPISHSAGAEFTLWLQKCNSHFPQQCRTNLSKLIIIFYCCLKHLQMNKSTYCWILSNFYFLLVLAFQKIKTVFTQHWLFFFFCSKLLCAEDFPISLPSDGTMGKRGALSFPTAFASRDITALCCYWQWHCDLRWGGQDAHCQPPLPQVSLQHRGGNGSRATGQDTDSKQVLWSKSKAGVQLLPPGSFSAQTAVLEDAAQAWPQA